MSQRIHLKNNQKLKLFYLSRYVNKDLNNKNYFDHDHGASYYFRLLILRTNCCLANTLIFANQAFELNLSFENCISIANDAMLQFFQSLNKKTKKKENLQNIAKFIVKEIQKVNGQLNNESCSFLEEMIQFTFLRMDYRLSLKHKKTLFFTKDNTLNASRELLRLSSSYTQKALNLFGFEANIFIKNLNLVHR